VSRVSFSHFALQDAFSAVPSASGTVFTFCAPGWVFDGTECVVSRFQVLRSWTRFRQYRVLRVPFARVALPDAFWVVQSVSCPVFTFCMPERVFGATECVVSRFHFSRSRMRFRRYRIRRVPVSRFTLPDAFSALPSESGRVFTFCVAGRIFGGTECVGYRSHVLRSRTHFQRYRVHRVPFSIFALPDPFSALPTVSDPFSSFALPDVFSAVLSASCPIFTSYAPGRIFGVSECVSPHFQVLRSRKHFRRYRVRQVLFSRFTLPDEFSPLPNASCLVFTFCAPRLIFDATEFITSCFHVLRSRTRFGCYRLRRVPFSRFTLRDAFSTLPSTSCLVLTFCAPRRALGVSECVKSNF